MHIIDIFTSRELATGIWTLIALLFCLAGKRIRNFVFDLIKFSLTRTFVIPTICIISYAGAFTALLFQLFSL